MPTATYPPGHTYGVPFLASITNGELLAGYGEWTANHTTYTYGGKTYHLYPWTSKIYDVTGWVTGLIELPSLNAVIPPSDVVFCDSGGASCLTASPPAGECIHIVAAFPPSSGGPVPPPALTNVTLPGKTCSQSSTSSAACIGYILKLSPAGPSTLTVTGVAPDGALDLRVSTSAVTTVSLSSLTCVQPTPTTVTLSTQAPTVLPAGAPPAPQKPNKDYRYLQAPVATLHGPLATATSSLGSDDFPVPAFLPSPSGAPCGVSLADSLDIYADGWTASFSGTSRYVAQGNNGKTAAFRGWAQFSATTSVVTLGFPVGPPPKFHL